MHGGHHRSEGGGLSAPGASGLDPIEAGPLRLRVVPASVLRAVAEAQDLGSTEPIDWPGVGTISPELWAGLPARMRLDQVAVDPSLAAWLVRGIVHEGSGGAAPEIVGHLGGHGAPDDHGAVEIGYTVARRHQRRGIATAAARAWFSWAHEQGATRARLSTAPDNAPSRAIAARLGFEQVGGAWDEGDACWEVVHERDLPLGA